jgi:hypothetical protein
MGPLAAATYSAHCLYTTYCNTVYPCGLHLNGLIPIRVQIAYKFTRQVCNCTTPSGGFKCPLILTNLTSLYFFLVILSGLILTKDDIVSVASHSGTERCYVLNYRWLPLLCLTEGLDHVWSILKWFHGMRTRKRS